MSTAGSGGGSSDIMFHVRLGSDSRSLGLPASQFGTGDAQAFQALLALIESTFGLQKNSFRLSYFDEEHEKISVTCWNDFKVAVDEHALMKKAVQLYVEQGDEEADEEDMVFINNSPNVLTKQVDTQAQTPSVGHVEPLTQKTVAAKDALDEKHPQSPVTNVAAVNPVTAANTSFWWRLFGNGAAANRTPEPVSINVKDAPVDEVISKSSAPVEAALSAVGDAASPVPAAVNIADSPPTLSLLLLSDLSELLTALRAETVTQLDCASADQLSATTHSKVQFQRTKQIFAEELREALADIRKRANRAAAPAPPAVAAVCASPVTASSVKAEMLQPAKKAEVQDAFAAIEEEEQKASAQASKSSASASYAAVVTASLGSSSSASAASVLSSASAESKSASSSSPAFSMSDESIVQVVDMCSRMGFKADVAKIRFLMAKSNGDYDTLIDWLITDSVVKFTVPK